MTVADDRNRADPTGGQSPIGRILTSAFVASLSRRFIVRPVLDRVAAILLLLVIVGTAAYALVRPDYNWDMVAYIATALEDRIEDPETLHAQTWAAIEPGAREVQLYHLQASNPYNLHQWENPVDFQSQLSMYRVKIAYIAMIRGLEPVFGLAKSSILLSVYCRRSVSDCCASSGCGDSGRCRRRFLSRRFWFWPIIRI